MNGYILFLIKKNHQKIHLFDENLSVSINLTQLVENFHNFF